MKLMILIIICEGYQALLNSSWCFLFSITELDRRKEILPGNTLSLPSLSLYTSLHGFQRNIN